MRLCAEQILRKKLLVIFSTSISQILLLQKIIFSLKFRIISQFGISQFHTESST